MASQQARFDGWRAEFNEERPHDALGGSMPASRYVPSARLEERDFKRWS